MRKQLQFLYLALLVILAGMSACGPRPTESPKETNLPFETIERADAPGTGQYYEGKEPKLVITAEAGEISSLGNAISANAQAQLSSVDFSKYLALAVFQGWKPTGGYGVEIQRVVQRGDVTIVHAHFQEPQPHYERTTEVTSPYHLVKVLTERVHGKTNFILNVDGTVVSQQTRYVP